MGFIDWPELVLILAILVFVFGGSRIKDLARGLGESVREFKKASSGEPSEKEKKEDEKAILKAAKKMGIETEGKNLKQILNEMSQTVVEKGK